MAVEIGTASDWLDLMTRLRDFLKTDTTLVADGENWTQLAGPTGALSSTDEIVLKAPGLAGADEILLGISQSTSVPGDYYNLVLQGLVSHNPAEPIGNQANRSGARVLTLWQSATPYWFVANGRRVIVVAKVSTVYVCAYAGFILPYCEPTSWPYPLFVGGVGNNLTRRWSASNEWQHSSFFSSGEFGSAICLPDTSWKGVVNQNGSGASGGGRPTDSALVYPWRWEDLGFNDLFGNNVSIRDNIDGSYALEPAELMVQQPFPGVLGVLQGVYKISGFAQSSENIVTVGGVDHLVVQNVYRTGINDYAAIALE